MIEKKKSYWELLPVIIVSIVIYKIISTPQPISMFFNLASPFIWAFAIAYLVNPLLCYIEKSFKIKRIWSILIVYIFFLGTVALIFTIITPRIINSIKDMIVNDAPLYINTTTKWVEYYSENLGFLTEYGIIGYIEENLISTINQLTRTLNTLLNTTIVQVINITSAVFNSLLGIFISVYMLKDKETFKVQTKKIIYSLFSKAFADKVLDLGNELNSVFSRYLVGKTIDSLIIGVLCFIGCLILGVPYPSVISTIVGITNLIPYFGPFIGMIPAIIITLFYSPIKALWVFLFILALQQFDGLYLGPKILGTKVGLRPFWIISAIIVGGGLFGVLGMFLAVPVTAMFKFMLKKFVDRKLTEKNIDM